MRLSRVRMLILVRCVRKRHSMTWHGGCAGVLPQLRRVRQSNFHQAPVCTDRAGAVGGDVHVCAHAASISGPVPDRQLME